MSDGVRRESAVTVGASTSGSTFSNVTSLNLKHLDGMDLTPTSPEFTPAHREGEDEDDEDDDGKVIKSGHLRERLVRVCICGGPRYVFAFCVF